MYKVKRPQSYQNKCVLVTSCSLFVDVARCSRCSVLAGECIMKWQGPEKAFPAELGSFNHRAEAFYRAHAEDPENYYVLEAKRKQLQRVSVLVWNTPEKVWSRLVTILNKFHGGAGANIMDYLNEASLHWQPNRKHK